MSVRVKTIVFAAVSLGVGLALLNLVSSLVLAPSYRALEERFVHTNVERCIGALEARLSALDATNHDWAAWDDTYDFVQTGSTQYIESNLSDATFAYMGLHVMVFLNADGDVTYAKAMDPTIEHQVPVPDDLLLHVSSGKILAAHDDTDTVAIGILGLAEGPMLVSARPILTSAEEGPTKGTLLMGTRIDKTLADELAATTRLPLSISPTGESRPAELAAGDGEIAVAADITVSLVKDDEVLGNAILSDIYGQPVALLSVAQDATLYTEGQHTLSFFLGVVAIGGVVLALLFVMLLDRAILRRISRLASQVESCGQAEDFAGQVSVDGNDEIANLAEVINLTLCTLSHSHSGLQAANHDLERTSGELKRTEQELRTTSNQLRRMTRHLQTIREDERVLVANEIHDTVGQGLAALKMDLSSIERAAARGELPSAATLGQITELLNTLLETVRKLSSGLRPSMLEDLGLAETIKWHLNEFGKERSIRTTLRVQGPSGDVETSRALSIFRIFQEALAICAEDPSITKVTVTLTLEDRYALVAIQDNGMAVFEQEALSRREMGLSLIRERADVYGGGVTATSAPDAGTSIVAQVPL